MSRTSVAAMLAAARRRDPRPAPASRSSEPEVDFEADAAAFIAAAPQHGWCTACGTTVDELAGVLHAFDCPYLPPERRKKA